MDDSLSGVTDFLNEDNIIPPHNLVTRKLYIEAGVNT